jgi:4-hydroxymandelate oxidase
MASDAAREETARGVLTPAVYDYFAGGAGDERTLRDNVAAWLRVPLRSRAGASCPEADTSVELLGSHLAAPILLAPVAAQRLLHPDGELASARAAAAAGTVFCLSTRATADLADVAAAGGSGPLWFQLYVRPERDGTERVLRRLGPAGYRAVVVTADLPMPGERDREFRHGPIPMPEGVGIVDHLGSLEPWFKPSVGGWRATLQWSDLGWIAEAAGLPVLVKGVMTAEDASLALSHGAAGVVVSNHGGRQLDGCLPTAVVLPEIVEAVAASVPVLVDGGIRTGADVLRALALGADAVLIGRPYAWGLAGGGQAGVEEVLTELVEELAEAMKAAGSASVGAVGSAVLA